MRYTVQTDTGDDAGAHLCRTDDDGLRVVGYFTEPEEAEAIARWANWGARWPADDSPQVGWRYREGPDDLWRLTAAEPPAVEGVEIRPLIDAPPPALGDGAPLSFFPRAQEAIARKLHGDLDGCLEGDDPCAYCLATAGTLFTTDVAEAEEAP